MSPTNATDRRDLLKGIGASLGGAATITAGSTTAAADPNATTFRMFTSGNLDGKWEDYAVQALEDAWIDQIDYGFGILYESTIYDWEMDDHVDTSTGGYTIWDGFRNWLRANGEDDTSQGTLNIFLADVREEPWKSWHTCGCGGATLEGDWVAGPLSTPNNYVTDGNEKGFKRSMTHEVAHACIDSSLNQHNLGDSYPYGTDYESTALGAGPCSDSYFGDPPKNAHGYGNDTVTAIEEFLETQSAPTGLDCCKYDSC